MQDMALVILAAGASRRMRGRDKLLEPVDGTPLLRRQARAASATRARTIVALPPNASARRVALRGLAVDLVEVGDAAEGMAASIRTVAGMLPRDCKALMVVPADMPELTQDDMALVLSSFDPDTILRGASGDVPGHPVLFPRRFFGELRMLTGDTGAKEVIARHGARLIPLPGRHALTDLDTPEDWADWRARHTL